MYVCEIVRYRTRYFIGLLWGVGGSREFAAELGVFGGLRFVLGIVFVARRGGVEDGPGKAAKSG